MVVVGEEIGRQLQLRHPGRPGRILQFGGRAWEIFSVIASEAKQSSFLRRDKKAGLLRRFRSSQ
jgi:hypothetical protein